MPRYAIPCLLAFLLTLSGASLAQTTVAYPHDQADLHVRVSAPDEA